MLLSKIRILWPAFRERFPVTAKSIGKLAHWLINFEQPDYLASCSSARLPVRYVFPYLLGRESPVRVLVDAVLRELLPELEGLTIELGQPTDY